MGTRVWSVGAVLAMAVGCGSALEVVEGTNFETGTYTATLFRITPDGGTITDVLGAGGSLTLTFDRSGNVGGSLVIPASVTGTAVNASMAGTAVVTNLTVTFTQNADTFVRTATWSRIERTIQLANYRIGTAIYDVSLQK
jgi:hypothetical protein